MTRADQRTSFVVGAIASYENPRCAEVGVWEGDLTEAVISSCEVSQYVAIDSWCFRPELSDAWYGLKNCSSQDDMNAVHTRVCRRLSRFIKATKLVIYRQDSLTPVSGPQFDFIYLDADHRESSVMADLQAWFPRLAVDGTLVADDYGVEGWFDNGVTKAVNRFVFESDGTVEFCRFETQAILSRRGERGGLSRGLPPHLTGDAVESRNHSDTPGFSFD